MENSGQHKAKRNSFQDENEFVGSINCNADCIRHLIRSHSHAIAGRSFSI